MAPQTWERRDVHTQPHNMTVMGRPHPTSIHLPRSWHRKVNRFHCCCRPMYVLLCPQQLTSCRTPVKTHPVTYTCPYPPAQPAPTTASSHTPPRAAAAAWDTPVPSQPRTHSKHRVALGTPKMCSAHLPCHNLRLLWSHLHQTLHTHDITHTHTRMHAHTHWQGCAAAVACTPRNVTDGLLCALHLELSSQAANMRVASSAPRWTGRGEDAPPPHTSPRPNPLTACEPGCHSWLLPAPQVTPGPHCWLAGRAGCCCAALRPQPAQTGQHPPG